MSYGEPELFHIYFWLIALMLDFNLDIISRNKQAI